MPRGGAHCARTKHPTSRGCIGNVMHTDKLETLKNLLRNDPFFVEDQISLDSPIKKFKDWDSFKHLSLLIEVEKVFTAFIAQERVTKIETIKDLLDSLET